MSTYSSYTYQRVINGEYNFAHVEVEVQSVLGGSQVDDATRDKQLDRENGEVNSVSHPIWVRTAMRGAAGALTSTESAFMKIFQAIKNAQRLSGKVGLRVSIEKVIGIETDTTELALRNAAALATLHALKNWRNTYVHTLQERHTQRDSLFNDNDQAGTLRSSRSIRIGRGALSHKPILKCSRVWSMKHKIAKAKKLPYV
jgi:hypothetical protein